MVRANQLFRYHRVEHRLRRRQHVFGNGSASVGLGSTASARRSSGPGLEYRPAASDDAGHPPSPWAGKPACLTRPEAWRQGSAAAAAERGGATTGAGAGAATTWGASERGTVFLWAVSLAVSWASRRSLGRAAAQAFDRRARQIVGIRRDRGFSRRNGDGFGDHRLGGRRRTSGERSWRWPFRAASADGGGSAPRAGLGECWQSRTAGQPCRPVSPRLRLFGGRFVDNGLFGDALGPYPGLRNVAKVGGFLDRLGVAPGIGLFRIGRRHRGSGGRSVRARLDVDVMIDDIGADDGRNHRRQDVHRKF